MHKLSSSVYNIPRHFHTPPSRCHKLPRIEITLQSKNTHNICFVLPIYMYLEQVMPICCRDSGPDFALDKGIAQILEFLWSWTLV